MSGPEAACRVFLALRLRARPPAEETLQPPREGGGCVTKKAGNHVSENDRARQIPSRCAIQQHVERAFPSIPLYRIAAGPVCRMWAGRAEQYALGPGFRNPPGGTQWALREGGGSNGNEATDKARSGSFRVPLIDPEPQTTVLHPCEMVLAGATLAKRP